MGFHGGSPWNRRQPHRHRTHPGTIDPFLTYSKWTRKRCIMRASVLSVKQLKVKHSTGAGHETMAYVRRWSMPPLKTRSAQASWPAISQRLDEWRPFSHVTLWKLSRLALLQPGRYRLCPRGISIVWRQYELLKGP